jgi:hypothetical protein
MHGRATVADSIRPGWDRRKPPRSILGNARFDSTPPPWTVEETAPCFIVRDHNGQALAFVYCEDAPGSGKATRRPQL